MDQIREVDKLFHQITDKLPMIYDIPGEVSETGYVTNPDGTAIISSDNDVEEIANLFDQLYGTGICQTGRYEREDGFDFDDAYVGLYYVSIA